MNTAGDGTAQGSRFFDDDGLDETSKRLDDRDRRGREKAQETLRLREAAIISPDVSPEDKARAVMDAAGEILMQTAEEGRKESRRQYDEAYDRYHDTDGKPLDGWLKAPNGKDTNLNEHQWAMVRTQNFKKWFGDWENKPEESSKVIDANGEPQVVYHGTNADFNVFDSEKQGTKSGALNPARGFFFTPDPGRAALYGDTVKAFFLNAKADRREARKQGLARDYIQQGEDFIVFSPAQIKSATDNAGTFNGDNPSILFQTEDRDIIFKQYHNADGTPKEGWLKAPNGKESNLTTYDPTGKLWVTVRTENFKKWFGDWEKNPDKASKIVDENGEPTQVFHGTRTEFEAFSLEKTGTRRDPGKLGKGFYFSTDKYAASAGDPITLALFASAKDPLYLKMDKWTQDKSETVSKALGFEGAKDSETIRDKLIQSGYDAVVLDYSPLGYNHQELMMLNPEQIKSATDNIGTFDTDNPSFLFQDGDRDMMEEAAGFENGKDYRGYVEAFSELPQEVEGFTDEQIDAWFEEFVRKSKQAANSREQAEGTTGTETATPAELDREFIELIGEPGELQNFVELLAATYNEDYGQWQAADEEDMANRDRWAEISDNLRRKFTHPTWQSIFKVAGRMGLTQQKQVLTMIRYSPREYRAVYADIMERPDMAVSAEDSTAAALKHRITDSRREDVDSLTPEKMRQLAEQLDIEDFAKKVRTGHAQFDDPVERAYIKQLQDQSQKLENDLKEIDDDRQEDNNYIERLAGKEFNDAFERAIKAREQITRKHGELDRAIKEGRRSTSRIAWWLQRQNANYYTIIQSLEALANAHQLELDIQRILSDEKLKDYAKSAKTEATLTVRLARKAERGQIRAHIAEIKEKQEAARELTQAKRGVTRRILRPINPRGVNAEQGRAVAIIQRLAEPSMLEGIDRFIGGIEKTYLRTIFETWKVDEQLRAGILKNKAQATAWTLEEAEELAKVIDDLIVQGKEVYKANVDAEQKRISAYQTSVRNTIRTVNKAGLRPEEIEKIIGRYDYGVAGTAAADAKRRASKGPLLGYADMNIYRFARVPDCDTKLVKGGRQEKPFEMT
jgi:hypothetical protein